MLRKTANTLTDLGGYANAAMQGGELHHHFKNNELDDKQFRHLLRTYGIPCNGIFIKDQLPRTLNNGYYIINLNGHSHWTALIKNGAKYFYFDAYGFPAPIEVEKKISNSYAWSNREIQDLNSSSCGWYCIAFLRYMIKSKDLERAYESFVGLFNKNTALNEKVLSVLLA